MNGSELANGLATQVAGFLLTVILVAIAIGFMCGWFISKPKAFDKWMQHHIKTCGQCEKSLRLMEGSLCEDGFKHFQDSLK